MNQKTDKQIDSLLKNVFTESELNNPSADFTSAVISKITGENELTAYRPLISKRAWALVVTVLIGMAAFVPIANVTFKKGWLDTLGISFLSNIELNGLLPAYSFSDSTLYGLLVLTIMIFVQIPILKHYSDKRIDIS
ncbi:MAG TPA: hypothetical protein ENK46_03170 [Flavobacteriia bacterium]|nr:hypothetical protein [Flavobacteriia bacterium]